MPMIHLRDVAVLHPELAAPFNVGLCGGCIFHLHGGIVIDDSGGECLQEKQEVCLLA